MSQAGSIRQRDGYWILRYRVTRPETRCKVCGQLPARHSQGNHAFDGENKLVRVQLLKKLGKVEDCDKKLKKNPPAYIKEEAAKIVGPVNNSTVPPERNITIGEFVETVYFSHLEQEGMKPSTMAGYRARWNSQLKSRVGEKRLREFGSSDAFKLFREIARDNPTMTRSTIHHFKSLLSAVYRVAIVLDYISGSRDDQGKVVAGNPIREAKIPHCLPEGEDTYAYSLDEEFGMIRLLPDPAKTAVAVSAFTGTGAAELFALGWEDWRGEELKIERNVWNGKIGTPKTKTRRAPVPVIVPLQKMLAEYRWKCGDPKQGLMFGTKARKVSDSEASSKQTPIDQSNLVDRVIRPTLDVCLHCGASEQDHAIEGHEYERDPRRPEWRGWHAFRRGLATNLKQLGIDDEQIQKILRHARVKTTQDCYIKTLPEAVKGAMRRFGEVVEERMRLVEHPTV